MAMSENSKRVLNFLKENDGVDLTAADVASALGIEKRREALMVLSLLLFRERVTASVSRQKSSLKMELIRQLRFLSLLRLVRLLTQTQLKLLSNSYKNEGDRSNSVSFLYLGGKI